MQPFAYFRRLATHFELMKRMMAKMGVEDKLYGVHGAPDVVRRAAMRCAGCDRAEACARWLDTVQAPREAPAYCRNHDLIERLRAS